MITLILKIETVLAYLCMVEACPQLGFIYCQFRYLFGFAPPWNFLVQFCTNIPFYVVLWGILMAARTMSPGSWKVIFLYRQTRPFWLVALGWYAVLTIGVEVLFSLGYIPHNPQDPLGWSPVLMHLGWIAAIPLIHCLVLEHKMTTP